MLDKNLCSILQFSHRSYVKKPMENSRSEKELTALAESLFVTDKDGRVKLEYPFLFICLLVGMLVSVGTHFKFRGRRK